MSKYFQGDRLYSFFLVLCIWFLTPIYTYIPIYDPFWKLCRCVSFAASFPWCGWSHPWLRCRAPLPQFSGAEVDSKQQSFQKLQFKLGLLRRLHPSAALYCLNQLPDTQQKQRGLSSRRKTCPWWLLCVPGPQTHISLFVLSMIFFFFQRHFRMILFNTVDLY